MKTQKLIKSTDLKASSYPSDYKSSLNGFGGGMILFIVGRFLGLLGVVDNLGYILPRFGMLPSVDTYLILIAVLIPLDLVFNVLIIIFIFKRKILFRKLMLIYTIITLPIVAAITIYAQVVLSSFNAIIISAVVFSAIWIFYLYKSKRVKNTYIYPYMNFEQEDDNKDASMQETEQ